MCVGVLPGLAAQQFDGVGPPGDFLQFGLAGLRRCERLALWDREGLISLAAGDKNEQGKQEVSHLKWSGAQ